jgi:flagellar biogenesis protein FliO
VDSSLRIIGRCHLEPRRSIYIVEVGERFFLIGVGDGPVNLLAELDKVSFAKPEQNLENKTVRFHEVMARLLRRRGR